jgi:hypothetical protein
MKFLFSTLFSLLATSCVTLGADDDAETDLSPLGENSLEIIEYEYKAEVDTDCQYTLTAKFRHDPNFPVGDPNTCQPGVDAEDGKPYLAGRWRWERFPEHVRKATGIDHISLDYNACGHPGPGFLTPHYDMHFYRVSPTYRATKMLCNLVPGTPACLPEGQDTPEGNGFFSVARSSRTGNNTNMPPNYVVHLPDAIVNMGMHSWNNDQEPLTPEDWIDPIFIIVTHDSNVVAVEPMFPFHYTTGVEDHFWEEEVTYVEQTISTLPYYYNVDYDGDSGVTTKIIKGQSDLCQKEFVQEQEDDDTTGDQPSAAASSTVGVFVAMLGFLAVGL